MSIISYVRSALPFDARIPQEKGQVSIDWSRYADEDEAQEKGAFDMSQFGSAAGGFGGMGGGDEDMMGGMGGMGGAS